MFYNLIVIINLMNKNDINRKMKRFLLMDLVNLLISTRNCSDDATKLIFLVLRIVQYLM